MHASRLVLLLLLPVLAARAQTEEDLFDLKRFSNVFGDRAGARRPDLDPQRIINESNSFLRAREPEMTAEEYALYEKVLTMLGSNPAFALRLLEAMGGDGTTRSPAFEFILGNAYYAAGDPAKAEASYRRAVERFPTFQRAWNNLGVLHYSAERYAEAVKAFTRCVALGDREPGTLGLLGFCLEKQGNPVAAEAAYLQALGAEPDNPDWQEGLLRLCLLGRQYGRAESIARHLLKVRPGEARHWLVLGNILVADGRKLEAIAVLETAAGAGVAGTEQLLLLGDLYAEQNLHAEALAIYTRLLQPAPGAGEERLLRLASMLAAAGRAPEARRALAALPAEPGPGTRVQRGLVEARLAADAGQWAEVRRHLEVVLAAEPRNGPALLALGRALAADGLEARAEFSFEAASGITETAYRARLELANLALRRRDYHRSVEHLEQALRLERTEAVADYLARVRLLAAGTEATSP